MYMYETSKGGLCMKQVPVIEILNLEKFKLGCIPSSLAAMNRSGDLYNMYTDLE